MECIQQYGLSKKYLQRFKPDVEQFYENNITTKYYRSDLALKYQKRFIRLVFRTSCRGFELR